MPPSEKSFRARYFLHAHKESLGWKTGNCHLLWPFIGQCEVPLTPPLPRRGSIYSSIQSVITLRQEISCWLDRQVKTKKATPRHKEKDCSLYKGKFASQGHFSQCLVNLLMSMIHSWASKKAVLITFLTFDFVFFASAILPYSIVPVMWTVYFPLVNQPTASNKIWEVSNGDKILPEHTDNTGGKYFVFCLPVMITASIVQVLFKY